MCAILEPCSGESSSMAQAAVATTKRARAPPEQSKHCETSLSPNQQVLLTRRACSGYPYIQMSLLDEVLAIDNLSTACASVLRSVLKNASKRYAKDALFVKAKKVRKVDQTKSLLDLMNAEIKSAMGELRKIILRDGYKRSPLFIHAEPKKDGGKRILMIHSKLNEKIFEKAVYQIVSKKLQELLDNGISYCGIPKSSVSNKKLGIYATHSDICSILQTNKFWILKADIEKFFDKLDRERVILLLEKHLLDSSLKSFFLDWVNIQVQNSQHYTPTNLGIPQGSCLSGLIANLYLSEFDEMQRKKKDKNTFCFRYADDLLFACTSEADRDEIEKEINQYLLSIGLQTKASKLEKCAPGERFGVLGYNYNDLLLSVSEGKISKWINNLGMDFRAIGRIENYKKKTGKYTKKQLEGLLKTQKNLFRKLRAYSSIVVPLKQIPDNINKRVAHEQAFIRMNQYLIKAVAGINRIRGKKIIRMVEFRNKKGEVIWPYLYPEIVGIRTYLSLLD